VRRAHQHVDAHVGLVQPRVERVLDAADDLRHLELELGQARDDEVVLVVARGGHDHVGRTDTAPLEKRRLRRVPVHDDGAGLLDGLREPRLVALDDRHVVVVADEDPSQVAADVAAAGDEHVHGRIPTKVSKRA
jgi:hypothetical protein